MGEQLPAIKSFSRLSVSQREQLLARSREAAEDASEFRPENGYPVLVGGRIWPVSTMMCALYPHIGRRSVSLVTRLVLWIFFLDDVVDDSKHTLEELQNVLRRCEIVTRGGVVMDEDGLLIRSLSQLRTEVAAYPFWERMENSWTESLCQMCRAMLCEKYWALGYSLLGSSVLPTHAAYMDWAWRSIGVWPMLQTMMITTADASLLEREPELTRLIRSCSVAVRLSNDLRSDAKERQEGGINALRIAENEPTGCGEPVVASPHSQVSRRMVRAISDLHELVRRSARAVDPSVESIGRTGQLLCEFYAHRDYHWSDTEPSWADSHEPRPSGTLDEGLKSAVGNVTGLCS